MLAPAVVQEVRPEGAIYRLLRVRRPDSAATAAALAAHRVPGQFVRVEAGGDQTFFALADAPAPGGDALELLLKRGGDVADAMFDLAAGGRFLMSDPEGEGYPLDRARGHDLVLAAAGSGIASIRAVLVAAVRRRDEFGAIAVYYGQRHPADFAFVDELAGWRAAGVTVTLCASAPDAAWPGARGRVPPAIAADAATWDAARTAVFVCGMAEMEAAVEAIAGAHGVPPGRVFTNV